MKFIMAVLVYLGFGVVLGWGILRTIQGHPGLLLAGIVVYSLAFAGLGCLTKPAS